MIYFIADLHFNHKNAIKMCERPFETVDEMNEHLLKSWNRRVRSNDEVYVLGDLALGSPTKAKELIKQLHGRKYLIRGNHDGWVKHPEELGFLWAKDYFELKENGNLWVLCHYPLYSWNRRFYGAAHLHGHTHRCVDLSTNGTEANRFACVSVECIDYAPISIDTLKQKFAMSKE